MAILPEWEGYDVCPVQYGSTTANYVPEHLGQRHWSINPHGIYLGSLTVPKTPKEYEGNEVTLLEPSCMLKLAYKSNQKRLVGMTDATSVV